MARPKRLASVQPVTAVPAAQHNPLLDAPPQRKHIAVNISLDAAKALRLFKAHMDWSHEQIVDFALLELKRKYPEYELPNAA